jgi:hypothetical protein
VVQQNVKRIAPTARLIQGKPLQERRPGRFQKHHCNAMPEAHTLESLARVVEQGSQDNHSVSVPLLL